MCREVDIWSQSSRCGPTSVLVTRVLLPSLPSRVLEIEASPIGGFGKAPDRFAKRERREPHPVEIALAHAQARRLPQMSHRLGGESEEPSANDVGSQCVCTGNHQSCL